MTPLDNRKKLLQLTWPIFLEAILFSLIGSMDTIMLSGYADNAVGAVGSVNQVLSLFQVVSNIITTGTGILCAQYIGAGKSLSQKQPLVLAALLVNTGLGALFSAAALFFGDGLLTMVKIDPALRGYAMEYLSIVGGFLFVQMITMTFTVLIRSHGKTLATMIFSLLMNVCNLVLNYVLIYGKLGLPALGVSGAAIATVVSKCLACIMAGVYLFGKVLPGMSLKPRWGELGGCIRSILAYGSPAAGEQISYTLSKIVVLAMVNSISVTAANTYNYVGIVVSYVYLFSMAVGQGTSIIVGWDVGKGEPEAAKSLCRFSVNVTFLFSMVAMILLTCFRHNLMDLFTNDADIIRLGGTVIITNFVLEAGRSRNLVLVNSLRAAGDVGFPLYVGLFSMWFFSVGVSWLLGIRLGLGLPGIWLGLGLDECFRALAMQRRWSKGKWMHEKLPA